MSDRSDSFLNFAYGSNMLSRRLLARTPGARLIGVATLDGHELRWHKRGMDGSGKCDVLSVSDLAARVHGVIWQIPLAQKPQLDAAEGLGQGYAEDQVAVSLAGVRVAVRIYRATLIDRTLRPFEWYRELVVAGAREQRLPVSYVARLQAVASIIDPDRERHARHMELTGVRVGRGYSVGR